MYEVSWGYLTVNRCCIRNWSQKTRLMRKGGLIHYVKIKQNSSVLGSVGWFFRCVVVAVLL